MAAIAAFIIKKNSSCVVKKITQKIDFEPAKSLDEAIQFGKKNFGIKKYSGFEEGDIDAINWINGGLTNVANAHLDNKVKMPRTIEYSTRLSNGALAAVNTSNTTLMVNKTIFSNFDSELDNVVKKMLKSNSLVMQDGKLSTNPLFSSEDIANLAEKYQSKTLSFEEKIQFYQALDQLNNSATIYNSNPFLYIKSLHQQVGKNIMGSIDKYETLSEDKQREIINYYNQKYNKQISIEVRKADKYGTIYHEMGHMQDKPSRDATYHFNYDKSKYPKELLEWVNDKDALMTAMSVSDYSTTGPGEFIAEVYKTVLSGGKISTKVANLYKKLGGPFIPKLN